MLRITHHSSLLSPFAYLLISLIATWPLITHLRGWVPGWGDWGQNMWALWWVRQAILVLAQHPFHTNYLFYSEGVSLLFHPLDVSDGLLALPLYGLLGGDITYNLMILLSFVLSGWGAYLLALHLTGRRGASFVAGLVFMLSPYHFLRIDLGHLNLSTIQWIPFFALFLFKFAREGSRRSAALAIFFLVFTALNSWYYVVYCGLLALAVIFWPDNNNKQPAHSSLLTRHSSFTIPKGHTVRNSQFAIRNSPFTIRHSPFTIHNLLLRLSRILFILFTSLLILSPLLIPMFRLLNSTVLVGAHNPLRHSADVLSFWVPGPPSTWSGWFDGLWASYAAQNREPGASAYLGYGALALAVLGFFGSNRRQVLWWLGVALGFSLLALGPQLQINGQVTNVFLPYQWLTTLVPIFSITGIPGRFVVMTALVLAILVAYGLATLIEIANQWPAVGGRRPAVKFWLCLAAGLLISLEYSAIPLRLSQTQVNDFYHFVAADDDAYAVLDIKWDANFLMHAQTIHRRPIIGGWLARLPQEQAAYLEQDRLDKAFLHLLLGAESVSEADPAAIQPAIQAALKERDARYIINHSPAANPWLEQFVGWPVIYADEEVTVYEDTK